MPYQNHAKEGNVK